MQWYNLNAKTENLDVTIRKLQPNVQASDIATENERTILLTSNRCIGSIDCASTLSKVFMVQGEINVIPFLFARQTGISPPQLLKLYCEKE